MGGWGPWLLPLTSWQATVGGGWVAGEGGCPLLPMAAQAWLLLGTHFEVQPTLPPSARANLLHSPCNPPPPRPNLANLF